MIWGSWPTFDIEIAKDFEAWMSSKDWVWCEPVHRSSGCLVSVISVCKTVLRSKTLFSRDVMLLAASPEPAMHIIINARCNYHRSVSRLVLGRLKVGSYSLLTGILWLFDQTKSSCSMETDFVLGNEHFSFSFACNASLNFSFKILWIYRFSSFCSHTTLLLMIYKFSLLIISLPFLTYVF